MDNKDMTKIFNSLNTLLGNTDISDVNADSGNFQELPDGYYLCEVETAKLTSSKSSGQPMAAIQFKVVEDGLTTDSSDKLVKLQKTVGRKIFINYVLKDDNSVRRFVIDMLKFEGETPGEPLLGKEYFTNSELLADALDILVGSRVYINSSTTVTDDKTSNWKNLISWKRATLLELPM